MILRFVAIHIAAIFTCFVNMLFLDNPINFFDALTSVIVVMISIEGLGCSCDKKS